MTVETANDTPMRTHEAIADYCAGIGLVGVELYENQRLDLKIDDRRISFCIIGDERPSLWIGCEIGAVEPDDRDALTWLLSAGMQAWFLRGERIGLLPQTTTAVIYSVIDVEREEAEDALKTVADSLLETATDLAWHLEHRDFTHKLN